MGIFVTLLAFQNCGQQLGGSGFETYSTSNSGTNAPPSDQPVSGQSSGNQVPIQQIDETVPKTSCDSLAQLKNVVADASLELQKCLDSSRGQTVEIPAGVYYIGKPIVIQGPINIVTKGKSAASVPCTLEDVSCAVFRSWNDIPKDVNAGRRGTFHINGPSVILSHLIFDGSRQSRQNTLNARKCFDDTNPDNSYGWLMTADGASITLTKSVLKNALCGTALEVHTSTTQFQLVQNIVANNGRHYQVNTWSDGVTIHDSLNSTFTDNTFIDNTDIQMVLGGCRGCLVARNSYSHTQDINGSSFAEMMIHAWVGGSGDYSDSIFKNNDIDCGSSRLCGYGIVIGGDPWYLGTKAFNGVVTENRIQRAMIGLSVDEVTGLFQITNNAFADILDGEYKCQNDPSRKGRSAVMNITAKSMPLLSQDTKSEFYASLSKQGANAFSSRDGDLCIPEPPYIWSAPFSNDSPQVAFLKGIYTNFLGRDADLAGLKFNADEVATIGIRQVILNIFNSSEAQTSLNVSSTEYVTRIYRGIFGREPDSGGLNFYITGLNNKSTTRIDIINNFLDSEEFKSLCQVKLLKY